MLALTVAITGCGAEAAPEVPGTPDGMVQTVSHSLADGQPGVLWNALPSDYQGDVNDLIEQFADNVDPEAYDKAFELANQFGDVLDDQKDYFLNSQLLAGMQIDSGELEDQWNTLVDTVAAITSSDLQSVDSLRSMDVGRFLSTTGATVMRNGMALGEIGGDDDVQQLARLSDIETEIIEQEEDHAVVEITFHDDETDQLTLTRVQDKWLPAEVVEDWEQNLAEKRQAVEQMGQAENNMQVMMTLNAIEPALDALGNAQSQQEFDSALMQVFAMGF